MGRTEQPTCDLGASIAQYLHLLLHTRLGELRCDPTFGCSVWDVQFDNGINFYRWEEELTRSLTSVILRYENRLSNVHVEVSFQPLQQSLHDVMKTAVRQQATITVTGIVQLTDEPFRYSTQLQLGQTAF